MGGLWSGEWREQIRPLCPSASARADLGPCDCGYEGDWLYRPWSHVQPCPPTWGYRTLEGAARVVGRCADCKRGGTGHETLAGFEEKCPRCGDIERFDLDGELVESRRNPYGPGFHVAEFPLRGPQSGG